MKFNISHILRLFFITLLINSCAEGVPRPNVVLILVDDMGWSDLGCYGSEISTPHIDELAANGMRFFNSYNTSKCFPSRAALLTGLYAQECGLGVDFKNPITNAVTLGQVLQTAGYKTFWSGKHHGVQNPYYLGFNRYYGLRDGASNHFNPGDQRENEAKPAQKRTRTWCIDSLVISPYTPPNDFYSSDYFTNYAVDYIEEASSTEDPFFLYVSYTAPHDPLMAWPEDIKKYKGAYDSGYEMIRQRRFERQKKLGLIDSNFRLSEFSGRDWQELSLAEQKEEARKMEVYAAMIDRIDQNVGRLIEKLRIEGELENTLILFMSDNGASDVVVDLKNDNDSSEIGSLDRWVSLGSSWANVSNTPFRYFKNYSYEGGIRTPFVVHWPLRIQNSINTNAVVHFVDIMPTVVELSGATYPEQLDGERIIPMRGESFIPAFQNLSQKRRDPLFFEWEDGQAVRSDNWKLVREGEESEWELYQINLDPTETMNVSSEFPEIKEYLLSEFMSWKKSLIP
ncbi:MAG: arylsulfatase [Bacteroidota bacterium]